ncbi:MAG: right-handed parallel beta-helix repeat-containing protein [Candidatus Saccharimonadales bacterium]|jgi:hypothetical protein
MKPHALNEFSKRHRKHVLVAAIAGITGALLTAGVYAYQSNKKVYADTVTYGKGVYEISKPIIVPDGGALVGAGEGQTILRAASGYKGTLVQTSGSLDPLTEGKHHPGVKIRDITIDGNKTAARGVYVLAVDDLVIENVEVRNTTGNGIEHRGTKGTATTQRQTWSNVTVHDCGGWGVYNGLRTRKVSYVNIKVMNCENGMTIDHSEAQANGIQVNDNKGDGLWIRNVFSINLTNIRATGNGRYGIHVQGMVYSMGTAWEAQNNGKTDVWFDASAPLPSFNYGVTKQTVINGLVVGKLPYNFGKYNGTGNNPLVIDKGVDVTISGQKVYAPPKS